MNENAARAPRAPEKTERQEPYDAGDEQAVRQKKARASQLEVRRVNGLRAIVANEDARLWLWDLLSKCGLFRSSFTGNSETFFKEGARNVGLTIQADIMRHVPESYLTMMKEGEKNSL